MIHKHDARARATSPPCRMHGCGCAPVRRCVPARISLEAGRAWPGAAYFLRPPGLASALRQLRLRHCVPKALP
jgi:hypothetical protein